jgi:hypothetical protein
MEIYIIKLRANSVEVSSEDLKPHHLARASARGGRPMKKEGLIRACMYICAYIHHRGMPEKDSSLVQAILEDQERFSEDERIGKTTIEDLVRKHREAINNFDDKL